MIPMLHNDYETLLDFVLSPNAALVGGSENLLVQA